MVSYNGFSKSTTLSNLYPGIQYSISITATNLLGRGMERRVTVILEGNGKCIYKHAVKTERVSSVFL